MASDEVWFSLQSLLRRRDQFSQAKARSTIQRLGKNAEQALLVALDHSDSAAEHLLGSGDRLARIAAIDEHLGDGIEAAKQQHHSCRRCYPILDAARTRYYRQQIALGTR